jgi:hypothetical protein
MSKKEKNSEIPTVQKENPYRERINRLLDAAGQEDIRKIYYFLIGFFDVR